MVQKSKIVFIALVVSIFILTACGDSVGDRYVGLAQCLSDKNVVMYGAYWCPHCANQKKMLGKLGFAKIKYVECDPRGEGGNPQLCLEKKIQRYPTWNFPDGERIEGEISPEKLAEKSGCSLSESTPK